MSTEIANGDLHPSPHYNEDMNYSGEFNYSGEMNISGELDLESSTIVGDGKVVVALADYDAVEDCEISIKTGDVIQVLREDDSGWWEGDCNGLVGWFPSNYVYIKYDLPTIAEVEKIDSP